jgi:hypothetical protein
MTRKKDLKRIIRERQAKTGERYAAARAQVIAQRPSSELVIELDDCSELAREVGLRVQVRAASSLRPAARTILERIHAIASSGLQAAERLRRAVILGERPPLRDPRSALRLFNAWREFLRGVSLGFRGVSPDGVTLALDVELGGERRTVVAHVYARPAGEPVLLVNEWRAGREPVSLLASWFGAP